MAEGGNCAGMSFIEVSGKAAEIALTDVTVTGYEGDISSGFEIQVLDELGVALKQPRKTNAFGSADQPGTDQPGTDPIHKHEFNDKHRQTATYLAPQEGGLSPFGSDGNGRGNCCKSRS